MPRQYVLCGQLMPRLDSHRMSLVLFSIALLAAVFGLLCTLPGGFLDTTSRLRVANHRFPVPKSLRSPWMDNINPFRPPWHLPALRKNDTDGVSVWYAHWSWLLTPFSSSVTLDENHSLLPMLGERTPVYCYYPSNKSKTQATREATSELLLVWRRAWWAQGFRPIILSEAEAINNPVYEELQKVQDITPELEADLMAWLAWEHMGNGLLASMLLFPMGSHDDPLLTYLRRGQFPRLTRFKGLDNGLLVGSKHDIGAAIRNIMASPNITQARGLIEAATSAKKEGLFVVDDTPKALAYYPHRQLEALYNNIFQPEDRPVASRQRDLAQLVNSHLHITWQYLFTDGIAVLKPLPQHTTHLISPLYKLALRLARCPETPIPHSCPPNRLKCAPCDHSRPLTITTPPSYANKSTLYTIGAVPHPYTLSTLNSLELEPSIPWIRRESPRDAWITSVTSALVPEAISTDLRLRYFKQVAAGTPDTTFNGAAVRSLWLPAEQAIPEDLDWHFGFALPDAATHAYPQPLQWYQKKKKKQKHRPNGRDTVPDGGHSANNPENPRQHTPAPAEADLALEAELIARAQTVVLAGSQAKPAVFPPVPGFYPSRPSRPHTTSASKQPPKTASEQDLAVRAAFEAWNLADTEAWRFARAYLARRTVERRRWEEEEAQFIGGVGSSERAARPGRDGGGGGAWSRWLD